MAHRTHKEISPMQELLAKARGETYTTEYKPKVYSLKDVKRAKEVLDRLVSLNNNCELSSIIHKPITIEEP